MKGNQLLLNDLLELYKIKTLSKNVYIDKLDDAVNKYNNRYKTIKMKPADIKSGVYIECGVEHNNKDRKFKVADFA